MLWQNKCKYTNDNKCCPEKRASGSDFCQAHTDYLKKQSERDWEIYKIANEHYRQDLREFWPRSNLYTLAQAFLFAAFATLATEKRERFQMHDFLFELFLGIIGVSLASLGLVIARDSTKWIDRWRDEIIYLDLEVNHKHLNYCHAEIFDKEAAERYIQNQYKLRGKDAASKLEDWCYRKGILPLVSEQRKRCSLKKFFRDNVRFPHLLPVLFIIGWVFLIVGVIFQQWGR